MKTLISLFLALIPMLIYGQTSENNGTCNDPIVGAGTYINSARTAGINLLGGVNSEQYTIDGDLSNYASMQLGVSLLGGGSALSIKDSMFVYPSGNEVGFVVQPGGGILNADVLGAITINLYLEDALVQTSTYGSGLVSAGVLSSAGKLQKVSTVATGAYDEVQIIVNSTLAGVLSGLNVYYAYEEPTTCPGSCENAMTTSEGASISGTRTGISGVLCLGCSVNDASFVTDNDTTNYAVISQGVGLATTGSISVNAGSTISSGIDVGFVIAPGSGLIDLTVLNSVRITTYLSGTQKESYLANNALVSASLLPNSQLQSISFKTTQDFDEVRISVSPTVAALNNLRVYYAFTQMDSDGDGIYDCQDKCSLGTDLMDNDGDGEPDACDLDDDNDQLTDVEENTIYFTDPFDGDTDNDGLSDFIEVNGNSPLTASTNPLLIDSDGDGIQDGTEVGLTSGTAYTSSAFIPDADPTTTTDPNEFDTDSDGLSDGAEDSNFNGQVDSGESDPNNPCDPNACNVDLELTKTVSTSLAAIGDAITYTVSVKNMNNLSTASGVQVLDVLPDGVSYTSHVAHSGTSFDSGTGIWNIDAALTTQDSVGLTITVEVISSGVLINSAEIIAADQTDDDSIPGNGDINEDDYDTACTSVPYTLCSGTGVGISVASGYSSYQWFKDGVAISGATSNVYVVTEAGEYTITVDGGASCVTGLCCPFIAVESTEADVTISGTLAVCSGQTINLTSSTTGTVNSYLWRLPNGTTASTANLNLANANASLSGQYTLEVVYASGCISRDTVDVEVNQPIISANLLAICNDNGTNLDSSDDTFTFSLNPSGGSGAGGTYSISGGVTSSNVAYGTTSSAFGPFNIADGGFTITLTDDNSSCSLDVTVTPPPTCSACQKEICIPITLISVP